MGRAMVEPLRFGIDTGPSAAPGGGRPLAGFSVSIVVATVLAATTYWAVATWVAHVQTAHAVAGGVAAGLVFGLVVGSVGWWRSARGAAGETSSDRHLVLDEDCLSLCAHGHHPTPLFALGKPFGAALLSNRARDRLVLALTSHDQALYVGSVLRTDQARAHLSLLSWASTVAEDEMVLDATGYDGTPLHIRATDLEALLRALLRRDGRALERCYLSDASGAPVELDGRELRVGHRVFDLGAALEWSASVFQEPIGSLAGANDWDDSPPPVGAVMAYQATWVRQGSNEVVLVALMASITANPVPIDMFLEHTPEVQAALLRDLRLMQAPPEPPPPRELRVAIDRAYMVRLRAALDRAPRASQHSMRGSGAVAH